VAAVASAAATIVSDAACSLRNAYRDLVLSVVAAEPARAIDLLLGGDVDLVVVDEYDRVPLALPEHVLVRELCREDLVVLLPPESGGRRGGVRLGALAERDWVMPPADAACGLAVRTACRAAGFEPRVRWESDDMLLLTRAVAAGHGVAVLPRRAVAARHSGESGIAVPDVRALAEPRLQRRLSAVVRAPAAARPIVAAVLDSVAMAAAQGASRATAKAARSRATP
jgi:DNA-binding transcriptional LysR family regulator